jgi:hypothetical protein
MLPMLLGGSLLKLTFVSHGHGLNLAIPTYLRSLLPLKGDVIKGKSTMGSQ